MRKVKFRINFNFFPHYFHLFNSSIHLKHGDIGIPKNTAGRYAKNRGLNEDNYEKKAEKEVSMGGVRDDKTYFYY